MTRSDLERLRDARDFARHARNNAGGLTGEELADACQPQHAALYDLAVIGETLGKVTTQVQNAAPHIEWRKISNLRNIIIHSYWQIDLGMTADVIERRLDPLAADLGALIALVEDAG